MNRTFTPYPDLPRAFGANKWTSTETTSGVNGTEAIANITHYSWIAVGMDARTADVAGAATLVSALDCMNLTIWNSTDFRAMLDMEEHTYGPQIPYGCKRYGAGYLREDYYTTAADEQVGERILLMEEDPYYEEAVVGTNITVVGGPYANLFGEYVNDFVNAFALDEPPFDHHWTKIYALTCWERKTYVDEEVGNRYGYGVISTYWDLNGTVFLWVWGWTAEDTAFLCQWIRDNIGDGGTADVLQLYNGTTDVVVKIDYVKGEAHFVECLGMVSECKYDKSHIHGVTD